MSPTIKFLYFVLGLSIILGEIQMHLVDPELLVIGAALVGVPAVAGAHVDREVAAARASLPTTYDELLTMRYLNDELDTLDFVMAIEAPPTPEPTKPYVSMFAYD